MLTNNKLNTILQAIKEKRPFHEQIPKAGKIVFNKVVPYFFLYRGHSEKKEKMLRDLGRSQLASIIIQDQRKEIDEGIVKIVGAIEEVFGSCLIIEVWIAPEDQTSSMEIQLGQKAVLPLAEYLKKNIDLEAPDIITTIEKQKHIPSNPNYESLFSIKNTTHPNIYLLGISIKENYVGFDGNILPILQRHYRESLAKALSRLFFEYIRLFTTIKPANFKLNIHKEITADVFAIDKALTTENQRFDFLLLVTPINVPEAWQTFKKNKFSKPPLFQYRPIPVDPDQVKRSLYSLPIEDIYDPTIAYLFRDKRRELSDMMSMLDDRDSEDFVHGSLQVFGNVSESLFKISEALLTIIDSGPMQEFNSSKILNAKEFSELAKEEIQYLQSQYDFETSVRIREDISGIMVNRGALNLGKNYRIPIERAEAMIQHEVGTHITTYFNGKAQPLQLFSLGVPGYEQLQEGLAVFAEYLTGGLTNERLRTIAARVIAVRYMLMGYSFVETFQLLVDQYHFEEEASFLIAMRVHRGGGLTKDAVYLQGLIELIEYIKEGNDLNLLTIGKIRRDYLPIIQDLIQRGFLNSPTITPRYLSKTYHQKIEFIKQNGSIFKLIQ